VEAIQGFEVGSYFEGVDEQAGRELVWHIAVSPGLF
jgi:hypothetical protein